jgi:hypothetical protein
MTWIEEEYPKVKEMIKGMARPRFRFDRFSNAEPLNESAKVIYYSRINWTLNKLRATL